MFTLSVAQQVSEAGSAGPMTRLGAVAITTALSQSARCQSILVSHTPEHLLRSTQVRTRTSALVFNVEVLLAANSSRQWHRRNGSLSHRAPAFHQHRVPRSFQRIRLEEEEEEDATSPSEGAHQDTARVQVLTHRTLFHHVTSYMSGWPHQILQFESEVAAKYTAHSRNSERYPRRIGFLPHVAIAENDQHMLETLYELQKTYHYYWTDKAMFTQVMRCAAYFGRFEVLIWLFHELSKDPKWTCEPDVLMYALENDHPDVELLSWIYAHCPEDCVQLDPCHMDRQVERGDLAVIKCLHSFGQAFSIDAVDKASAKGNLAIVQFLHEIGTPGCTTKAMDGASKHGHLDVVRFLHEHRTEGCTTKAMDKAPQNAHLDTVKFLYEHRTEGCSAMAMDSAAREGHLEIVQFLHEHRSEGCTRHAMAYAASNGHLEVGKFFHENRTEGCAPNTMYYAAEKGYLDIATFLHENYPEGCTSGSAVHNHVQGVGLMDDAAFYGHLDVVKFLHDNRRDGCTTEAADQAVRFGHLDVVKFLHFNRTEGCTTEAMDKAACNGYTHVVAFLHENRTEGCTDYALSGAVKWSSSLNTVRYLHEHRTEEDLKAAMWTSTWSHSVDVFKYLFRHRGDYDLEALVPVEAMHKNHEVVKHMCLVDPHACSPGLLNKVVLTNKPLTVRMVCEYSS